ncbi:MAG: hypothetical protein K2J15_02565 [Muribaculaceae bacterium]|nr:hypothetical protein [Muribaculaceae bacterium]
MTYIIGFILLFILIRMLFGEHIKRWVQRRVAEKMEDTIRARMGMPSAKEERQRRRQAEKEERRRERGAHRKSQWTHAAGNQPRQSEQSMGDVIIPREYAEDVEFVEYKEFTSATATITTQDTGGSVRTSATVTESQVTDVEYVEIKTEK